jgi:cleavage and polyadenylation specificity factor subunit 4
MNPLFHPGLEHSFHFESFVQETFKLDLKHRPQAELIKASSALQQQQQQQNVCKYFLKGTCHRGTQCSFFHPKDARGVVCKHYLRGLCSKGDLCEFLHEVRTFLCDLNRRLNPPKQTYIQYNLKRMPECWFFTKYGECSNPECLYLHIDPASKIKPCPWYARGFCKHGMSTILYAHSIPNNKFLDLQ